MFKRRSRLTLLFTYSLLFLVACSQEPVQEQAQVLPVEQSFTVAVIPDTQNYVDFTLQPSAGFPLDSAAMFIRQMDHIAGKGMANGGDIAFVASVGDVWQHVFSNTDPDHASRGLLPLPIAANFDSLITPVETRGYEIPKAIEGYQLISDAGIPFGVAPGNHDYDAWWSAAVPGADTSDPQALAPDQLQVHIGGLDAFRQAFGSDTAFFRDKDWYLSGYNGGGSSAQVFSAGGYRFLHLAFEMQAGDAVLAWAQGVIDANPGLPTLISTHDYLNPRGERLPAGNMNLALVDPGFNNSAEVIWDRFIRKNDQILMVLSGHQLGQATRIDDNDYGHKVYQMLADYQGRGQSALDAGVQPLPNGRPVMIGDGWYREMTFHLGGGNPRVDIRTYSTHYQAYSGELPTYAPWYRSWEQPDMSDTAFLQADEFVLELGDFYARFGEPAH